SPTNASLCGAAPKAAGGVRGSGSTTSWCRLAWRRTACPESARRPHGHQARIGAPPDRVQFEQRPPKPRASLLPFARHRIKYAIGHFVLCWTEASIDHMETLPFSTVSRALQDAFEALNSLSEAVPPS